MERQSFVRRLLIDSLARVDVADLTSAPPACQEKEIGNKDRCEMEPKAEGGMINTTTTNNDEKARTRLEHNETTGKERQEKVR